MAAKCYLGEDAFFFLANTVVCQMLTTLSPLQFRIAVLKSVVFFFLCYINYIFPKE